MGQIDKFRAAITKSKGFARTSKFSVRINPPILFTSASLNNATYTANGQTISTANLEFIAAKAAVAELANTLNTQINLFCKSVELPGHDLQTQAQQHGSAPVRDMVQAHGFEGMITASFYLSSDLKERHFFEQWQRLAVNVGTHKANYYDDYIGSMDIYQLNQQGFSQTFLQKPFDIDVVDYGIRASEVYPATISEIEYSYENGNQIATMAVGFNYREWRNLGDRNSNLRPYS